MTAQIVQYSDCCGAKYTYGIMVVCNKCNKRCKLVKKKENKTDWKSKFDEEFVADDGLMHDKYAADDIKKFIEKLLKKH